MRSSSPPARGERLALLGGVAVLQVDEARTSRESARKAASGADLRLPSSPRTLGWKLRHEMPTTRSPGRRSGAAHGCARAPGRRRAAPRLRREALPVSCRSSRGSEPTGSARSHARTRPPTPPACTTVQSGCARRNAGTRRAVDLDHEVLAARRELRRAASRRGSGRPRPARATPRCGGRRRGRHASSSGIREGAPDRDRRDGVEAALAELPALGELAAARRARCRGCRRRARCAGRRASARR